MKTAHSIYMDVANEFQGLVECPGNKGPMVERFQSVAGATPFGQPYCVGYVIYCADQVDLELGTKHCLKRTLGSVALWEGAPDYSRTLRPYEPKAGMIVVWRIYKGGKPTWAGHVGIILEVFADGSMETIEANTSNPHLEERIERDGEGVNLKIRRWDRDMGRFKLMGFIDPWAKQEEI